MRVALMLEQTFAPVPGGTGRYSIQLWQALLRTAESGSDVQAWTAWHSREVLRAGAVPSARRLPAARRALALAWEYGLPPVPHGAEVVHSPTPLAPTVRVPSVVTVHDTVPWTHPETLTPRGVRWHIRMTKRAVAHGAHIAVPTRAVAESLVAVGLGVSADHLHVLGAGVSASLAAPPTAEFAARTAEQLSLPARFVLALATFEPRKGIDVLFDAVASLGSQAPDVVLVGRPGWGEMDPAVQAQRRGIGSDRIRILTSLPDDQLAVVLRRAEILVMPSRAEGFGLPVVEAMAVGTPVICSDDPALREVAGSAAVIVRRGESGPLAAAIAELLGDCSARRELSSAGLRRARDFSWDDVGHRAWRLYRSLV